MNVTYDSRDDTQFFGVPRPGEIPIPQYRVKCPHCGTLQMYSFEKAFASFGPQRERSTIVLCNQEWDDDKIGHHVNRGCGRRFVLDIRVDVLATSTTISE